MVLERMSRVRAQRILCVVAGLLSALLGSTALLVDVVGGLAGLRLVLALGLGGLTAGVGGGHFDGMCSWGCEAARLLGARLLEERQLVMAGSL